MLEKTTNSKGHKTAIAFGHVLRELRLKRKLTQEQLSFKCGVARAYISQLELGNQLPSLDTMLALSRGLEVGLLTLLWSATFLAGGAGNKPSPRNEVRYVSLLFPLSSPLGAQTLPPVFARQPYVKQKAAAHSAATPCAA